METRSSRRFVGALILASAGAALLGISQASAADLPSFSCSDRSGGSSGTLATLTSMRAAHHDGYDRVVFEFANATAVPAYRLTQQASSTFFKDASGQPITLEGSAGLRSAFQGTNHSEAAGAPVDAKVNLPVVREVALLGDFERVTSYGIGLSHAACFRTIELQNPARLVIDVVAPADAQPATAASNPPSTSSTTASPAASDAAPSSSGQSVNDLAQTGNPIVARPVAAAPASGLNLGLLAAIAAAALLVIGGAILASRSALHRR